MVGSRVKRGFRRLGIVLASPFIAGAVIALGFYVFQDTRNYFERFDPVYTIELPDKRVIEVQAASQEAALLAAKGWFTINPSPNSGPAIQGFAITGSGGSHMKPVAFVKATPDPPRDPEPLYWAAASIVAGLIAFLACVTIGWVLAGFARDEEPAR